MKNATECLEVQEIKSKFKSGLLQAVKIFDAETDIRGVLEVWTPILFSKRMKVPFLQSSIYIKKEIFLRVKRHGTKNSRGVSTPAPIFLRFHVKRLQ